MIYYNGKMRPGKACQAPGLLLQKLAITLEVTADELIFDSNERGPDENLKLQFEAISKFEDDEKEVIKAMLEALILRHDARRWQK
jgi:hypothetical protein